MKNRDEILSAISQNQALNLMNRLVVMSRQPNELLNKCLKIFHEL